MGLLIYCYKHYYPKPKESAIDCTEESTAKTRATTKGTKYTKEFLSVFSKILNFHASHL